MKEKITASEAVFGFAAWLTTRPKSIRIGAKCECGIVARLVGEWCATNKLPEPRKIYPHNIKHPSDKPNISDERTPDRKAAQQP